MKTFLLAPLLPRLAVVFFLACAADARAQVKDKETGAATLDPDTTAIIKRATDYLAGCKQASFSAEIWQDVTDDGPEVQVSKTVDVQLRRPDRLCLHISTVEPRRSFYYDGKTLTMHDRKAGFFGAFKAPPTIDATIDAAEEKYHVSFPLEDVLISRPFGDGAAKAKTSQYLGLDRVLGVNCHHLAFQSDAVEWQAWVEDGPLPLMRKVMLTFKDDTDIPRFTALFSKWDFQTELPDLLFEFKPPEGASQIEVVAAKTEP